MAIETLPIFQEPWWLDIVAPHEWKEVKVERNGQILADWKFVFRKRYGLKWITMPPFTPHLGPVLALSAEKRESRASQEMELLEELVSLLPEFDYFNQRLCPIRQNWLPFFWRGFRQSTLYTYSFPKDDLLDLDQVWREMKESTRRQIRKAEKKVEIQQSDDGFALIQMIKHTFARKTFEYRINEEMISILIKECLIRRAGQILLAKDEQKNIHAGIFVVWDQHTLYYLLGGADDKYRSSGAMSLLLWNAIRLASEKRLRFDFEGSMVKGVERFFRGFGAHQQPYFKIYKTNGFLANLAYWWIERKERAIKS